MFDFSWVSESAAWAGLISLTFLEIVLGIDNIIFISILAGRLPANEQDRARRAGLAVALVSRILLILSIGAVVKMKKALFELPLSFLAEEARQVTGKDLVLFVGGLFLMYKAVKEIHHKLEGEETEHAVKGKAKLGAILAQIFVIDVVFSLDSIITAVGMVPDVSVMIIAVLLSVGVMMVFAKPISDFVNKHPSVKMLALAFLILIGVSLVAESMAQPIPKGYIYFAMAFSVVVEMLNLKLKSKTPPVELRGPDL
jgi:predicted tellurium resistance membrane protein TerC